MNEDLKRMFDAAKSELYEDRNKKENIALREIIKIEKEYFYNKETQHSRLKKIREIVDKYGKEG